MAPKPYWLLLYKGNGKDCPKCEEPLEALTEDGIAYRCTGCASVYYTKAATLQEYPPSCADCLSRADNGIKRDSHE